MKNYWQGEKVQLRAVEPEDAPIFHTWNQDSERARNLDFLWPPQSLAAVQKWLDEESLKKLENDAYHWVIENRSGEPVGSISTHNCNSRNGTFSYGVDISSEQRGNGYAKEAIQMVLKYYFDELRYQKVTIPIVSDNQASIHLHQKLGFQQEGRFRRMLYSGGKHIDVLWYGMTKEEYSETI